ncbi:MAG TPA: MFS transporter [Methanocorpusculum sp.]|nr:MFS transporter [Methanocorpusculum sp.]
MSETADTVKQKVTAKVVFIAIAACLLFGVLSGFRSDMSAVIGIMQDTSETLSYVDLQLANTVCRFVGALSAPVIAFLTLKKSNLFVLTFGFITSILGVLCMAVAQSLPLMIIGLGILFALGTAALSFGIIFGIVSPLVGEKVAIIISTLFSISTTFFGVLFSPIIQGLSNVMGYQAMLIIFCLVLVCIYPLSFVIAGRKNEVHVAHAKKKIRFKEALSIIFKNRFTYILIGFFLVLGLASGIGNHLYTGMLSLDIPSMGVSFTFSILKIIGAVGSFIFAFIVVRIKRTLSMGALIFLCFGLMELVVALLPVGALPSLVSISIAILAVSALYPLSSLILRREYAPVLIASVFSFVGIFEKIGAGINSIVGSIIYDAVGNFQPLIIGEAILLLLFTLFLFIIILKRECSAKKSGDTPEQKE